VPRLPDTTDSDDLFQYPIPEEEWLTVDKHPSYYDDVIDFMFAMNQMVRNRPSRATRKERDLRATLIKEEMSELLHEFVCLEIDTQGKQDDDTSDEYYRLLPLDERLANIAKEMADVLYVVLGAAGALGIPFDQVWKLVRESNLAKASGPVRDDGKKLKPEGWVSPMPQIIELMKTYQS
jgi:predicted HAD superfamily Cof-like phosphohydrolase